MQTAVPELMDLVEGDRRRRRRSTASTTRRREIFGRQCLIARRLVERGVRFVELLCQNLGHDRWDQHSNLKKGHEDNARAVDQADRGAAEGPEGARPARRDAGDLGRRVRPHADGPGHATAATTTRSASRSGWPAAASKGGTIYGATDEYGYHAVENKVEIHDLHATMLHLLGFDHTKLTYRFGGRDMRLTDVHGEVVKGMLA